MAPNATRRISTANALSKLHAGDRPMKHVNVPNRWYNISRSLQTARPVVVLALGFCLYVGLCVVFSLGFLACGASCFFVGDGSFGFSSMFYLSVHTFSTVGYGRHAPPHLLLTPLNTLVSDPEVSPRLRAVLDSCFASSLYPSSNCVAPQLLMLLESYVGLMVTAALGGYVFTVFVRTRPPMRFSQKVLITKRSVHNVAIADLESAAPDDVEEFLTLRVITSEKSLRDVTCRMQATLWRAGGDGSFGDSSKGRIESLELEQNYFTSIEQIQLYHKINAASPLHDLREVLLHQVECVDVAITATDTCTGQEVKLFKHYDKLDIIENAAFDVMFDFSENGRLQCDHSKFDDFISQTPKADIAAATRVSGRAPISPPKRPGSGRAFKSKFSAKC